VADSATIGYENVGMWLRGLRPRPGRGAGAGPGGLGPGGLGPGWLGEAWYKEEVDLRTWIVGDLDAVRRRFLGAVAAHVPRERWREHVDDGGSSLAGLLLHVTVHQDLATRTAVEGSPPLFAERAPVLGLPAGASPLPSLQEAEEPSTTGAIDLDALETYAADVHAAALALVGRIEAAALDEIPPASDRLVELGGVARDDAPWLHDMWAGKPAAWFVQWELIGHAQGHVGEMVSVRDRMGYRPF
jgi:hypothetical protein